MIDWAKIYKKEFYSAPDCWKTCSSYCCKNFHGGNFKILDQKGVVLPFLPGEYEYFKSVSNTANIASIFKERRFRLKNGVEFSIHFAACYCAGGCAPHDMRPVICRIYPFIPVVNPRGDIIDFDYASLQDIFYGNPQRNHPCTLARERAEDTKNQLRKSLPILLKEPQLIFIFMAAKLIIDRLKDAQGLWVDDISSDADLRSFYRKYEWNVFSCAPWKTEKFKSDVLMAYESVERAHGKFII